MCFVMCVYALYVFVGSVWVVVSFVIVVWKEEERKEEVGGRES